MIYMNNRLVARAKAVVSVFDHGFLYGDGIYETMRVYKGVVFKIHEHMERLFQSASMIGLGIPKTPEGMKEAVYQTLKANKCSEAVIRITISRGAGPLGLDPALCPEPTLVIMCGEFKPYPGRYHQKGIKIAVVRTRRNYHKALDPRIKSLNFLNNILAKREAKESGALEAIMLNYRGEITEGAVSNIFFVKDDILCTPSMGSGILGGITRSIVLDIAKEMNIHTKEGRFRPESIQTAGEVFISNTSMEVMPVSEVDAMRITKTPGKTTIALIRAYKKKVAEYIKREKG